MKHASRLLLAVVCGLTATMTTSAQSGSTSLWNGKNLDGWTTWMRQPEATSDVPGLARGADGKYTEPIGSGRERGSGTAVAAGSGLASGFATGRAASSACAGSGLVTAAGLARGSGGTTSAGSVTTGRGLIEKIGAGCGPG